MKVEVDYGPKVKIPEPHTTFQEVENELRRMMGPVRDRIVSAARGPIPRRSGRTAAATYGRVVQSQRGFAVRVANTTNAHHLRFLQGGTGRYGPRRRKIPLDKRGFVNGRRPSGKGMRPQKTISKMFKAVWDGPVPDAQRRLRQAWEEATLRIWNDAGAGR